MSKLQAPGLARAAELLERRAVELLANRDIHGDQTVQVAAELREMAARIKGETLAAPGSTSVLQRQ